MTKRLIVRMPDHASRKGIVLREDECLESLKTRIITSVFPELKEVFSDKKFSIK